MKYNYIKWNKEEKCAIFFPDIDYSLWKKTQLKENAYNNPSLIISSCLITKMDILELFEYYILFICGKSMGVSRWECNNLILLGTCNIDNLSNPFSLNTPKPTYISEYINILGQLFLAGYIDFGSYCDEEDRNKIDYPSNLSYYKEDKYQAWIYFRDNFFYTEAYCRDIMEVKEPYKDMSDDDYVYSSWNTPQYWDRYRFWVARTEKGTKYLREILEPRIYNKYKDLEVEIDDKGSVLRWIGEINR
ncbi:hypothetical protein GHY90_05690 [Campylobacter coli]|nr:hypothetical protein [Campylobacter coli]EAJ1854597.1 hypothetical protein [Campylobacter coli]EAJ8492678.1 hypothetical protein [Campylobacter coli]ECZ4706828.1 hypothetical protein [Campylobacter coli]EDN2491332.1 hypothetical protein [Campylobacter coli]